MRAASERAIDRQTLAEWANAYLRNAPLSLCLRELNRLIAMELVDEENLSPVLDVGCGDGFWWTMRGASGREIYGIDIAEREVAQAAERIHAAVGDVSREVPFQRGGSPVRFQEIVGNCSLEHVRDIDAALRNLRDAAAPNARLVLFVPTPQWMYQGLTQKFLLRRFPRLAMMLSGAVNGFFQHWHLYELPVWQRLLEQNRWRLISAHGLGSARSEFLFRLFLPPAFLEFIVKSLVGVYPSKLLRLLPDRALAPLRDLMTWAVADPLVPVDSPHAYEYVIVAECTDGE